MRNPVRIPKSIPEKKKVDRSQFLRNEELTATTNPQFATGPQKCVVLGPTGEFQNALMAAMIPPLRPIQHYPTQAKNLHQLKI